MSGGPSPKKSNRPAIVRYFFDANILGAAKIMVQIRSDVTYPGDPGGVHGKRERPPCLVTSAAARDEDWIPIVAREGWSIITRDRRILERPAELEAVRDNGAKLFAITSREALNTFGLLEVLMRRWRDIDTISATPGPYAYGLTRSAASRLLP